MNITLYQCEICPLSRFIFMVMKELDIDLKLNTASFWQVDQRLIEVNPTGTRPTITLNGKVFVGISAFISLLEDNASNNEKITLLYGKQAREKKNNNLRYQQRYEDRNPQYHDQENSKIDQINNNSNFLTADDIMKQKAYIKYLVEWFCNRFYYDCARTLIYEKIVKVIENSREIANSNIIRCARNDLNRHLLYTEYLLEHNNQLYLAGDEITLADYAAAGQISTLDMIHEISWKNYKNLRRWYSLIKSRPSTQSMLKRNVPAVLRCPEWYSDPDNF